MKIEKLNLFTATLQTLNNIFLPLFVVIGVLNLFLVHPVPGIFYLVLSILYVPQLDALMKEKVEFSIPLVMKVVIGLVILWGTLAVGDLAEVLDL